MEIGYITALGTPHDKEGRFLPKSYAAHVEHQMAHGAGGLLAMGSMGLGVFVRQADYAAVARTAAETARGRVPVYIGVSDSCAARCRERVDALEGLAIDGVVATAPYYYPAGAAEHRSFFEMLAASSKAPLYLYDLPAVSKSKLDFDTVLALAKHPNIKGIKTPDLALAVDLAAARSEGVLKAEYQVFYSGLDTFDSGARLGLRLFLDGMPACAAPPTLGAIQAFRAGDFAAGRKEMAKVLALRNVLASEMVFTGFTHAMNLLGFEGNFAPDYQGEASAAQKERIKAKMTEIGLL